MLLCSQAYQSLYGLKQAGYNWFERLQEGLIARDFIQSQTDKCVFFQKDCIVLTYVDDWIGKLWQMLMPLSHCCTLS